MKLYAAPLQRFYGSPTEIFIAGSFGGIDAYYTPFDADGEKGEFP